jgi:hypothetical protein
MEAASVENNLALEIRTLYLTHSFVDCPSFRKFFFVSR